MTRIQILEALVLTILAASPHPALVVSLTILVFRIHPILDPLIKILAALTLLPHFLEILEVLDHHLEALAHPVLPMEILGAQHPDQLLALTFEQAHREDLDFLEALIKPTLVFPVVLLSEDLVLVPEMAPQFPAEWISAKLNAHLTVDYA